MDILEKLGIDYSYGDLPPWQKHAVQDYVYKKEYFDKALSRLRDVYQISLKPVCVGRYLLPYQGDIEETIETYESINKMIKENTSENWNYSHVEIVNEDNNDDPYCDYEDMRDFIYVYANVTDDNQPNTHDQEVAMNYFEQCKLELDRAKDNLMGYFKNDR